MRLIDADELINVLLNDHKLDGTNANWEINRILVHIKDAPTVEQEYYITGAQWDQFMKEHRRRTGAYDKIKAIINGWAVDDDEHELLEEIADIISAERDGAENEQ